MLTRMKVLTYRASTETFLNSSLPRVVFLASLDMCSPIQRLDHSFMVSTSLSGALALLECPAGGERDWEPVHTAYHYGDAASRSHDKEGSYAVYVLNDSQHANIQLTKARVCFDV